jgi:hypothetical protein
LTVRCVTGRLVVDLRIEAKGLDQVTLTIFSVDSCNETAQAASLRVNGLEFVGMGRDG